MNDSTRMRWLRLHSDAADSIKKDAELRGRISSVELSVAELCDRIEKIERVIANSAEKLHSTVIETYCNDLADHGSQMDECEVLLTQLKYDLEHLQSRIASKLDLAKEIQGREQDREDSERLESGRREDAETQFLNRSGGPL